MLSLTLLFSSVSVERFSVFRLLVLVSHPSAFGQLSPGCVNKSDGVMIDLLCLCCFAGKYRTQLWDKQSGSFLPATPGLGMHVEIKDPDTKVRTDKVVC